MTQKRVFGALSVGVFALLVGPLVVPASSHAAAPTAKPGEILDFPTCDGIPLDPYTQSGGAWTDDGRYVSRWRNRKMMNGIYWGGGGSSEAEARWTESLGNVAVHIYTSRAPKGTTRFQLRYWTGSPQGDDRAGPFHATFFKKSPLRIRIPAEYDTRYSFQVVALRRDCIAYTTSAQGGGVGWCSVEQQWVNAGVQRGQPVRTLVCPTAKD